MAGLVQYNFSIDDASAVLSYSPYADFASASGRGDGLHNGWQTWYTGSGYLSDPKGPSPVGESFHSTSLSGASVSLSFYGTGVALYGITNCSYDVTLDGSLVPNTTLVQGVLFSTSDKEPGFHNVSLIARPDSDDQILSFNSVIVTSVANSTAATAPVYTTIDNQNTSAISYTGDWTLSKTVSNIPSSASPAPFHSTTASGASASLNFTGRAVAVYGSSTTNHGPYSIALDGANRVFNGSSEWLLGNMLMFYQDGLEENSTHSLNITNLSDGIALSLGSVQITHFDSAPAGNRSADVAHGSSKVGAIVGPVIAFAVVASAICLYICTKRRAKHASKKLERRSSVASSIFLPRRFRRKYNGHDDTISPYVVNIRASDRDPRVSSESSYADGRLAGYLHGTVRARDEKGLPFPTPSSMPVRGANAGLFTDQRSARSIPVTYLPSGLGMLRNDAAQNNSRPPTYPPPSSDGVSLEISDDPSVVERILELMAQRIDTQRASPSSVRPGSVNQIPPYPEDV